MATPAASRLAARNAAKPASTPSILASATLARRTAQAKIGYYQAEDRYQSSGNPPAVPQLRDAVVSPPALADVVHLDSPVSSRGVGFSPGAVGRSIAAAIAPLLEQSAKKMKLKAAPGDLSAPKWPGELEVASQPDKLTLFEAARVKYGDVHALRARSHPVARGV
jgi:hypothetical protein